MGTAIIKKHIQQSREFYNAFPIEMKETSVAINESLASCQPGDISYIQALIQESTRSEGSVLSLASRSCLDQLDAQLLSNIHLCRYDECNKFHNEKSILKETNNPFSPLKNALLYLIVALFVLWITIYSALTKYSIL